MSKNPYVILNKDKVINYYKDHTLVECGEKFNCCEETIKRRLIEWDISLRTKKEAINMFMASNRSKSWRKKKSKSQKQKYKKHGQKIFGEGFRKNIGSFKTRKNSFKGKENGRWKGGNSPPYWRQRVIGYYGAKCDICKWDKIPEVLEAHHRDYDRKNNTIKNGRVLCPTCHRIIHFRERGFK